MFTAVTAVACGSVARYRGLKGSGNWVDSKGHSLVSDQNCTKDRITGIYDNVVVPRFASCHLDVGGGLMFACLNIDSMPDVRRRNGT